jgi:hydroxymethylpyrimidine pyrophosphatase-like HAD family hydrolase
MKLALMGLKDFDFPYLVLAQNGTIAMQMPSKKVLFHRYIPVSHLRKIEWAYEGTAGDFVVFSGFENGDKVYWRPHRMDAEQSAYVLNIARSHGEEPIALSSFAEIPEQMVPLVKCFGTNIEMHRIAKNLHGNDHFNLTVICDPYAEDYSILLITDRAASKGLSLLEAIRLLGEKGTIIAAGDDENDASLLKAADIKIAMAHAPNHLQDLADFIAPPTCENGIIQALQLALRK